MEVHSHKKPKHSNALKLSTECIGLTMLFIDKIIIHIKFTKPLQDCFCLQIKVSAETAADPDACLIHNTSQPY